MLSFIQYIYIYNIYICKPLISTVQRHENENYLLLYQ
jgi:hypothetical protein